MAGEGRCSKSIFITLRPLLTWYQLGTCLNDECTSRLMCGRDVETVGQITQAASDDKEYREPAADTNGARIGRDQLRNGFFTAAMRLKDVNITPSAKLTMAMAVILEWQTHFPDDKIIGMPGQTLTRVFEC